MTWSLTRARAQTLTDVLFVGAAAFYFVTLFIPPLVIMIIGLVAGTVPSEAEGGVLGFGDSYPAFNPQSWLMWVPAAVMLFLSLWTIPLPLGKFPSTSRASLINATALMFFFGLILSSAFVGAPGIEGEAVLAALTLGVALVLFLLRALLGLLRLVPRSWRESPAASDKRPRKRTNARTDNPARARAVGAKTIHLDFDRDVWLYAPESWPFNTFANVDEWADTTGRLFAESAGVSAQLGDALAATVRFIAVDTPEDESRFIYMGDAFNDVLFVSIVQLETDESISLEDLALVDDAAATRPVEVEALHSSGMGAGLRSLRYVDSGDDDDSIIAIAQYVWRADGLDVVMIASNYNVENLIGLLPVLDDLALSVSVVPA